MADEMSQHKTEEVREFYERMPYPGPLITLDEHQDLYKNANRRRAQFHRIWPGGQPRANLEILVAGCGTSQAARYALREPDARITGIDLSETSLRHTQDLQRKYNLKNLELHQLPIEHIRELDRSFDLIICTGVLHHLPDPDAGLQALRDALRPQGAMQLMVYAPYGRAGIYMMQKYCSLVGLGTSESDLKSLAATLEALPANHPIADLIRRSEGFRRPGEMVDALLHPVDRAYSVPELYSWLERCGMAFSRWTEQAPYVAQCGLVANCPHAARLASLPALEQYAAVELLRGTMVTHSFIAYRDDHLGENQPITFAGDVWRDYIPIALPWTVCVRERTPPGSVAVLINRAHSFTDLLCTVNSVEDRLFSAIDGKRTLNEILQFPAADEGERKAIDFFERLWQYDQVVFDARRIGRRDFE
jgi:SAM-dependent methyltransferase